MAYDAFDLSGTVALVTGGNSGIGLGFAEGLAQAGADVCIWGTNEEKNANARKQLARHGTRVEALRCDVGDADAVAASFARTVELLGKMLTLSVPATNLAGPITIGKVTGDSARAGLDRFLWILALLSISLGIINLMPIPILDGGHVVYSLLEIVRSKPVSMRAQAVGAQIGLAIVVGLMLFVFYVDIARWLPGS